MNEDFAAGVMLGAFVVVCITAIIVLSFCPSGDKSVIKDCLSDKPNICRTITTYTTPYKEER